MIGNWIKVKGEIVKVVAVMEGHLVVKGQEQKLSKEWEPVMLTERILSRFDLSPVGCYSFNGGVVYCNGQEIFRTTALHELQDIYRVLTRSELRTK